MRIVLSRQAEIVALAREAYILQNELMDILKTIPNLENLIIIYYDHNHEKLTEHYVDVFESETIPYEGLSEEPEYEYEEPSIEYEEPSIEYEDENET
jgi:hypothetical protein